MIAIFISNIYFFNIILILKIFLFNFSDENFMIFKNAYFEYAGKRINWSLTSNSIFQIPISLQSGGLLQTNDPVIKCVPLHVAKVQVLGH